MDLPEIADEQAPREPRGLAKLLARFDVWLRMRLGRASVALPTVVFGLGWLYLNAFAGASWPLGESGFPGYLRPSPEATIGLAIVCAVVWIGRKPHAVLFFVLAAVLLFARLLRTADALMLVAFDRPFHLSRDAGLVWELFILLDDNVDRLTLIGYMAGSAVVFGMLVFLAKQAFTIARNYFVERGHRLLFLGTAGALALLSLAMGGGGPYQRSPIASAVGGGDTEPRDVAAEAEAMRAELRAAPHGLEKLEGRDVYLIHIPYYGRVLVTEPDYRAGLGATWAETEQRLGEDGFSVRSGLLETPARRGLPWLTHATLLTGIRAGDQATFDALLAAEPDTLATFFREAGHRTARFLPGATRERPERQMPGFGMRYHAWELGYLGQPYGAVALPDQFALFRVWEREVSPSDEGVFADVVLDGVAVPFAAHPPYVEDWSTIGTGEIYRDLDPVTFETSFDDLGAAGPALVYGVRHELTVVRGYLADQLPDPPAHRRRRARAQHGPLVIVIGDSQPPGPLARDAPTDAVIVHAIARDDELLAPFGERGFTEGMVPTASPPYEPLETFTPWFLEAFSEPAPR